MTIRNAVNKQKWLYNDYSGSYYLLFSFVNGVLDYYIYMEGGRFYHIKSEGIDEDESISNIIDVTEKLTQEDPPQQNVIKALFTRFSMEVI